MDEASGSDGDLGEGLVARRPPHDTQPRHNFAEGARHLSLRLILKANIEECVGLVISSSSTPDESLPDGPCVLAAPLQSRHHTPAVSTFTVRRLVVAASQTLSWFTLALNGAELSSLIGGSKGAQTEGQKMLCAPQLTPEAYVDAAQVNTGSLKLQVHLGGVRGDQKLHSRNLRDGERCQEDVCIRPSWECGGRNHCLR